MKIKLVTASLILSAAFLTGFYLAESTIKKSHEKFEVLPSNHFSFSDRVIDILHYNLTIDLFPAEKILKGKAVITGLLSDNNLKQIKLDFHDNMLIKSLLLNNNEVKFYHNKSSLIINTFDQIIDTFVIEINYEGTPKRLGFASFVFGEINGRSLVYTLNEPNYASTWFPCNDIPDDKALLDIKITSDSQNVSVSNGILIGIDTLGNRVSYHWKTIYPISTYLICIYSSNYVHFNDYYVTASDDTMQIKYYSLPENYEKAKIDWEDHPQMLKVLSSLFGEYPFIKEKYGVAEFLWRYGAMEHQTITGIGTNFISGKKFFTDTYVHELAHHWWGNSVGPKTWKDIWLNEGFATYSEALYNEFLYGKNALVSTMLSKVSESFNGRLYDPIDDLFSPTIYNKGAWVLHMLRNEVGDSSFFAILRGYYNKYKYSNASTQNFIEVCEEFSGKNLSDFFNHWVFNEGGLVRIDYTWKVFSKETFYILNLNIENLTNMGKYSLPLEIVIQYDNKEEDIIEKLRLNYGVNSFTYHLNKRPNDVVLDPNYHLFAKIIDKNSYEK